MGLLGCNTPKHMEIKGNYHAENRSFQTEDTTYRIGRFDNGIALLSNEGYLGLVDTTGKILCTPRYDRIFGFRNGIAIVCRDNLYGMIDAAGTEILAPSLTFISDFSTEIAWYRKEREQGLITKEGKRMPVPETTVIRKVNGQYTYADANGYTLLSPKGQPVSRVDRAAFNGAAGEVYTTNQDPLLPYDENEELQNKRRLDRSRGMPDRYVVPDDLPFYFSEGLAIMPKNENGVVRVGYIDVTGKEQIPFLYERARHFTDGSACVKQDGKWGAIDPQGQQILPFRYEDLHSAGGNHFIFRKDGKYGVIDRSGNTLIAPAYLRVHFLFGELFALLEERDNTIRELKALELYTAPASPAIDSWGVMNAATQTRLLPFSYNEIIAVNDRFGIGVRYRFEETGTADTGLDLLGQAHNLAPQRDFTGQAISDVFNDREQMGTYTSTVVHFRDHLQPSPNHAAAIIPYYEAGDFYAFSQVLLDTEGKEVNAPSLRRLSLYTDMQLLIFADDVSGKKGVKDINDRTVLPPDYDAVQIVSAGIIAERNDRYGYFDLTGKMVLPLDYEQLSETASGALKATSGGNSFLIAKNGQQLISQKTER